MYFMEMLWRIRGVIPYPFMLPTQHGGETRSSEPISTEGNI